MNTDHTDHAPSPSVAEVERDVEARSAVFKKELGLFDLVLTQVVFVVGTFWVGWAGQAGSRAKHLLDSRDRHFLPSACCCSDFSHSPDATRGRSLSVGQACLQRLCRFHGRVESLGLCDLHSRRHRFGSDHQHLLRHWTTRRVDERQHADDHAH